VADIDPAEYQSSLRQLTDIWARMIRRAEELSTGRRPYRDRTERCAAGFGCRPGHAPRS